MATIILATRNPGKITEIRALLTGLPTALTALDQYPEVAEVVEDGATLEENALKKARQVQRELRIPALADDSGLEVFHLAMRPGVFSARYAGEHVSYSDNNRKLLLELSGVPRSERRAQFRCAAAFVDEGVEHVTLGACSGTIGTEPRGSEGFGYDPLFVPDGYDLTFAELPAEIKNSISHRASALSQMKGFLSEYFR